MVFKLVSRSSPKEKNKMLPGLTEVPEDRICESLPAEPLMGKWLPLADRQDAIQ